MKQILSLRKWTKEKDNQLNKLITSLFNGVVFMLAVLFFSCNTDYYEEDNINKGQNLLNNAGLEEWLLFWGPEWPKNWSLPDNDYVKPNFKIVYKGITSARMQSQEKGNTARLEQVVPITPGTKLRIRFHYYVEQWKEKGARAYCYFRTRSAEASNISAEELKGFYDKNTYYIIRGGGYGLTYLPHDLNVWQVFDETIKVPSTATYFVFGINSYYETTIYVDDCWVIDVTQHSTNQ